LAVLGLANRKDSGFQFRHVSEAASASLKNAIDHHSRPNELSSRLTGE